MSTAKPKVIVTRKLPDAVETRMRDDGDLGAGGGADLSGDFIL